MLKIAVTGGVACGKSHFCKRFGATLPESRFASFDCDVAVRELLEEADVQTRLEEKAAECGVSISDSNGFQKSLLRKVLFENSIFRGKVESELHPLVLKRSESFKLGLDADVRVLMVEVPLLFEVDFPIPRDLVLVVASSPGTQMRRLVDERHLPQDLAVNILESQMPIAEKMKRAEVVVWNDGSLAALDTQAEHLSNRCISLFN